MNADLFKNITSLLVLEAVRWSHRLGGWGDGGLGLTDRVIAVRPEFPAPCGCGLWLWGSFRGWAQLSGELGLSGTPGGIRELRPPVGTSADDPSQTRHRVRRYWNLTPALAATQHHSRLLAPARQLGCRRDQRLLPRRVVTRLCPRVIVRVSRQVATPFRGKLQTRCPAIRVEYGAARHQFARSARPWHRVRHRARYA